MIPVDRVDELVDLLGCSILDAQQIIEDDKKIDKGERLPFDLSKEDEKKALKLANVTTHKKKTPTAYKWDTRERKTDATKEGVIQAIADFLKDGGYEGVEITNPTKLIAFKIGVDDFEFNLIRKRKKKK